MEPPPPASQQVNNASGMFRSRLGDCMMCKMTTAKYCCPQCNFVSCSLHCSAKHKKEFECSGVRNKTNFVPVKEMNELHLLSDYRLLEDLSRVADSCSRDTSRRNTRKTAPLPVHLQKLRKAVSQRKSRIYFLPKNFVRHKENTTMFDWRAKKISWRLKLVFLHAQKFSFPVTKCPEDLALEDVINKCLAEAASCRKDLRKHFEAYQYAQSEIEILLQVEKIPGAQYKMFILDKTKTLKENLEGKRIVEFPTLYIVIKGFFNAENITDLMKEDAHKSKIENLLMPNYSLEGKEMIMSSDDEEGSSSSKVDQTRLASDDDSLDEALDCLRGGTLKTVLNSLYKQVEIKD